MSKKEIKPYMCGSKIESKKCFSSRNGRPFSHPVDRLVAEPDNKTALCNGFIFESVARESVDRFVYILNKNKNFNAKPNRYENVLKIKLCVQYFLNENDPLNDFKYN